jgi:CubicO group peptidase (beta-lactamase class C family)
MASLVALLPDIQARLDALARLHRVPGAVLAVSKGDELLDFATGVINARTGVDATTDSVFQIGSNTKLMTATLVMQLADAGKIELDAPVRRYLPSFGLAEPGAADEITIRHLLTHTSGIEGDYLQGFGRGDDAVERYVGSLTGIGLIHRPGQMWSYCNSGYVLAGYLVEKVTGLPYHQALAERICAPLGLTHTTVLPEQMLARRCAVGHVRGPDQMLAVAPVVLMDAAQAPAGSRTAATAAELARFVRMHLADGAARDGTRLLSVPGARAMRQAQVAKPRRCTAPETQGLGWMMADWDGAQVIGHGGGTIGQTSFLQAVPEQDLVIALLTNASTGGRLWQDLGGWLFETIADVTMPRVPKPPDPPPDLPLGNYAGRYERLGVRHDLAVEDGQLVLRTSFSGSVAELPNEPSPAVCLRPVDSESFYAADDGYEELVTFLEFQQGRPGYLVGSRAARRAVPETA